MQIILSLDTSETVRYMIPEEAPVLSIVIPVFNRAESLPKTLETIRSQSFTQWECILIDDFSTDNAAMVCEEYATNDPRFVFLRNSRKKGAPGTRNTGILSARGSWVILFDSDNFMQANALQTWLDTAKQTSADVVVCHAHVVNEQHEKIGQFHWTCEGDISHTLLNGACYVDNNLSMIRTELLHEIGLTDEDCPSYQEWDTHIRLSKIARYATVKEELVDYFRNTSDSISANPEISAQGYSYVLIKHLDRFKAEEGALHHHVNELLRALDTPETQDLMAKFTKQWTENLPGFQYDPRSDEAQPSLFRRIRSKVFKVFGGKK